MTVMKTKATEPLTTESKIDFFFGRTILEDKISPLSKALDEIENLKVSGSSTTQAYCMMLWATIEMLSRFYSGQLGNQQATKRLKNFLRDYFPHNREMTQVLLLFRNACMHSVVLHSFDPSGKKEVRFQIQNDGQFLESASRTKFSVNVNEFRMRLDRCINKYRDDLEQNKLLQVKFEKVFLKMGYLAQ
mgnify:CR=1 FL=1